MLKCKDIAHRASEFIDSEQSWQQKLSWHLHLFICSRCRRFVSQLRLTLATLRRRAKPQASREDVAKIMQSLPQGDEKHNHDSL